MRDWLAQALGNAAYGEQLAAACERLEVGKDEIIAAQGEPARSMHFILEGRVGIIVGMEDGRLIRVRSLGPHTTIGEMGLDHQTAPQRHHPGRGAERALRSERRRL